MFILVRRVEDLKIDCPAEEVHQFYITFPGIGAQVDVKMAHRMGMFPQISIFVYTWLINFAVQTRCCTIISSSIKNWSIGIIEEGYHHDLRILSIRCPGLSPCL